MDSESSRQRNVETAIRFGAWFHSAPKEALLGDNVIINIVSGKTADQGSGNANGHTDLGKTPKSKK